MLDNLWIYASTGIACLYAAGPLAIRSAYRFAARCNPVVVPTTDLPEAVAAQIVPRIAEMENLGFALVGCYDCGELAVQTKTFLAYFCNRATNDFANVTAMVSPRGVTSYFEFSTYFSNGRALETNNNRVLPLTPGNPDVRVFRFADIHNANALLQMHRRLLEKYAISQWPQGEPKGQEIQRWVRTVENYGPRHAKIGYMTATEGGQFYRLTWKGAFLLTWRGLWPASLLRKLYARQSMNVQRHELEHQGIAALQKA